MRLATIVDIPKIITILLDTYTEEELLGMEALLSLKSRDTFDFQTFISDEDDIVIFFERMGNFKCQFHLYSLKEARGKKVKKFFYQCVDFLINNTLYSLFLTFIPLSNSPASLAARYMGFTKIGRINSAGGDGVEEDLYMITKEQYLMKRGK